MNRCVIAIPKSRIPTRTIHRAAGEVVVVVADVALVVTGIHPDRKVPAAKLSATTAAIPAATILTAAIPVVAHAAPVVVAVVMKMKVREMNRVVDLAVKDPEAKAVVVDLHQQTTSMMTMTVSVQVW